MTCFGNMRVCWALGKEINDSLVRQGLQKIRDLHRRILTKRKKNISFHGEKDLHLSLHNSTRVLVTMAMSAAPKGIDCHARLVQCQIYAAL